MKSLFDEFYNEMMARTRLDEIKMSLVWEYVQDDSYIFAVVSACRGENETMKNDMLSDKLENDIKKLGHGYVKMNGGFVEDKDGVGKEVKEQSFLVTAKSGTDDEKFKNSMIMLGKKYNQDSILYKDGRGFYEISTSTRNGHTVGQILNTYESHAGKDNLTMAKKLISKYFSELLYGPHHGRKFLFQQKEKKTSTNDVKTDSGIAESKFILQEYVPIKHNPRWLAVARGEKSKWITIVE